MMNYKKQTTLRSDAANKAEQQAKVLKKKVAKTKKEMPHKYRPLTKEEEKQIMADYEKGMKRINVILKYEITENQFINIIKIAAEKLNSIIAHPKHFKFND